MRAFIAIEIPDEIKDSLSRIQEKLKAEPFKVSWVKPQNLHLTLKFLGDISLGQLSETKQIISGITKTSGFGIKLNTLGVFPDMAEARIIWVGDDQPPLELKELAEQLEIRLSVSGIPRQQRPFNAHITIGRIKNRLLLSDLQKVTDKIKKDMEGTSWKFNCSKVTLFESKLGPGGPTYTVLDQFNLKIN
ncbi:MAG: RNA 2',3'-cyclic phosphodiesterase [Candidatus Omnitrophica bacterium]|nr:RNA 2',3'-cyclic phosphodiesterase [Candidatus Omnitrophota bacterium]